MAVPNSKARETELQTRSRILWNAFSQRENCIALRLDAPVDVEKGVNPFGFHFEIDAAKYKENKTRRKRESVTRWLALTASLHHKYGIRHLFLVLMMLLYAILGGFLFEALEADNEREIVAKAVHDMDVVIAEFVDTIRDVSRREINETDLVDALTTESKGRYEHKCLTLTVQKFYIQMLHTDDRYLGSAWHKTEDLEVNIHWTLLPAMFYAFTLFSTIGYGSISCYTWIGRYVSIVYACIGIPLMLLTIGDLGELLQRKVSVMIKRIEKMWICCQKRQVVEFDEDEDEEDEEEEPDLSIPVWIAVLMLLVYLFLVSVSVWLGDKMTEQKTDFPFAASFYFVFISITTTGFGDVMPNNAQYNPLTSLAFVFGLVLLSVVNTCVYSNLYDWYYAGVISVEGKLEALHTEPYATRGHKAFKKLYPPFSTLCMSFPSTDFARSLNNTSIPQNVSTATKPVEIPTMKPLEIRQFESLKPDDRSSSITVLPQIPEEDEVDEQEYVAPRNVRPLIAQEGRRRSLSLFTLLPSIFGERAHSSRGRSPILGTLGGVDIAAARRRREIARMKRITVSSDLQPF